MSELDELKDLIDHIWIHEGNERSGYKQMTTEQKMLYRKIILEKNNFDMFTEPSIAKLTNFDTVKRIENKIG